MVSLCNPSSSIDVPATLLAAKAHAGARGRWHMLEPSAVERLPTPVVVRAMSSPSYKRVVLPHEPECLPYRLHGTRITAEAPCAGHRMRSVAPVAIHGSRSGRVCVQMISSSGARSTIDAAPFRQNRRNANLVETNKVYVYLSHGNIHRVRFVFC